MISKPNEVLLFQIWGDYAHFRKVYTTVSQLTYGVPPRTTLSGLIAAILGLPRDSYYSEFLKANSRFATIIKNPISKVKINLNLLKTKDETEGLVNLFKSPPSRIERIQVPFEMVYQPCYQIYVWLSNSELYQQLRKKLRNHHSMYTLYLGITECIANFKFLGEEKVQQRRGDASIASVVRKDQVKILVEENKRYIRERVPGFMDQTRTPLEYIDLVYEEKGESIKISDSKYWKVGEQAVIFF